MLRLTSAVPADARAVSRTTLTAEQVSLAAVRLPSWLGAALWQPLKAGHVALTSREMDEPRWRGICDMCQ